MEANFRDLRVDRGSHWTVLIPDDAAVQRNRELARQMLRVASPCCAARQFGIASSTLPVVRFRLELNDAAAEVKVQASGFASTRHGLSPARCSNADARFRLAKLIVSKSSRIRQDGFGLPVRVGYGAAPEVHVESTFSGGHRSPIVRNEMMPSRKAGLPA